MKIQKWIIIVELVVATGVYLYGDSSGKIVGRITDKETSKALPGVNITLEGTTMETVSDIDGYYVLLNVPPGKYDLKIFALGYQTTIIKEIMAKVDHPTERSIALVPTVTAVTQEAVVLAKEPLVKKDLTTSVDLVSGAQAKMLPVVDIVGVVAQQTGVIKFGEDLVIRGGRTDEVIYVVDGVEIRDPYSNVTTSGIPLLAMEKIAVHKGGFDVDQGTVASGAMNITTKEGGSDYSSTIRTSTTDLSFLGKGIYDFFNSNIGDPYQDIIRGKNLDLSSKENRHKENDQRTEITFSGPLVPGMRKGAKFFLSGEFQNDQDRFSLSSAEDYRNWSESYQWKLTAPLSNFKFFTSGFYNNEMWREYDPAWRLAPDHTPIYQDRSIQFILGMNHIVSPKTYWELRLGYYDRKLSYNNLEDVDHDGTDDFADRDGDGFVEVDLTYFQDSLGNQVNIDSLYPGARVDQEGYVELQNYWWESEVQTLYPSLGNGPGWWSSDSTKPLNRSGWGSRSQKDYYIFTYQDSTYVTSEVKVETPNGIIEVLPATFQAVTPEGDTIPLLLIGNQYADTENNWDPDLWLEGSSKSYNVNWRLTSQVGRYHEILAGLEYKRFNIMRYGVTYASGGNIYLSLVNPDFIKREGDSWNFIDWYKDHPINPWIFAAYLRDKVEIKGVVAKIGGRFDYYDPGGWAISDPQDPFMQDSLWGPMGINLIKNAKLASKRWYVSPRVGISYPFSKRDIIHFSYGHYSQIPQFSQFLQNYVSSGAFPIIGNADIKPSKEIYYEVGIKHTFNNYLIADLAAFYKDIDDWARLKMIDGRRFLYVNEDWGSVRGIELNWEKRLGGTFLPDLSIDFNYTFQVARGSFSSPENAYEWALLDYPMPPYKSPLDWDQRHKIFTTISYVVPQDRPLFKVKGFDNLGISLQHYYGSGFPYTPPIHSLQETIENINARRLPSVQRTDLRAFKDFSFKRFNIRLYMDILNLFNRKDIEATNFMNDYVPWYEQYGDPEGEVKDPSVWGERRKTRIGLELNLRGF